MRAMCALITAACLILLGIFAAADGPSETRPPRASDSARTVLDFGATGDGQTDDTAAIQRAVDAGGQVRFPSGVYRLTKPVVIQLDRSGFTSLEGGGTARIVMSGTGAALQFVGTHQGTADPASVQANVWDRQRAPLVHAIEIVGDHEQACGIQASGTMQLTLTRVIVRRALHAIRLTGRNRNVLIANCHVYDNRGVGVFYDDVDLHQSNIVGCHISYNQQGGVVSRAGNVRNIHIGSCDIESNQGTGTDPTANVLIDCTGGSEGTAEVAITGCTLQHNNPSPSSANIRILGRSPPSRGLELVREGNIAITGNVMSDVQMNVHLKDCRGVVLADNTFWQGYQYNLLVEDCSNVVVGPNNFDRNPRYNYGNTQDANNALLIRNCEDCTLTALHVTNVWRNPAGLTIENCRRMNITACTILDCDGAGLLLKDVSQSRVSDCLISDNRPRHPDTVSLRMTGGQGNMIVDNLFGGGCEVDPGAAHLAGNVLHK